MDIVFKIRKEECIKNKEKIFSSGGIKNINGEVNNIFRMWECGEVDDVVLYKNLVYFIKYILNKHYKMLVGDEFDDFLNDVVVDIYCLLKSGEYYKTKIFYSVKKFFEKNLDLFYSFFNEKGFKVYKNKSVNKNLKMYKDVIDFVEVINRYNIEILDIDIRSYIYTNVRGLFSKYYNKRKRYISSKYNESYIDIYSCGDEYSGSCVGVDDLYMLYNSGRNLSSDLFCSFLEFKNLCNFSDEDILDFIYCLENNCCSSRFNKYDIMYYVYLFKKVFLSE